MVITMSNGHSWGDSTLDKQLSLIATSVRDVHAVWKSQRVLGPGWIRAAWLTVLLPTLICSVCLLILRPFAVAWTVLTVLGLFVAAVFGFIGIRTVATKTVARSGTDDLQIANTTSPKNVAALKMRKYLEVVSAPDQLRALTWELADDEDLRIYLCTYDGITYQLSFKSTIPMFSVGGNLLDEDVRVSRDLNVLFQAVAVAKMALYGKSPVDAVDLSTFDDITATMETLRTQVQDLQVA